MGIFELRVWWGDSLQSWRFGVAFGVNIPPMYCNAINRKKITFRKSVQIYNYYNYYNKILICERTQQNTTYSVLSVYTIQYIVFFMLTPPLHNHQNQRKTPHIVIQPPPKHNIQCLSFPNTQPLPQIVQIAQITTKFFVQKVENEKSVFTTIADSAKIVTVATADGYNHKKIKAGKVKKL